MRLILLVQFVASVIVGVQGTSSGQISSSSSSSSNNNFIPRSNNSHSRRKVNGRLQQYQYPPWNPSSSIDSDGFLLGEYRRVKGDWESQQRIRTVYRTDFPCRIRQVPGDGSCLFHSISLCLHWTERGGEHWNLKDPKQLERLHSHSYELRQRAVQCLQSGTRTTTAASRTNARTGHGNQDSIQQQKRHHSPRLFLQGRDTISVEELTEAAAGQYQITPEEYCEQMKDDATWGGGPEILALCNELRRPIHVYELAAEEEVIEEEVGQDRGAGSSQGHSLALLPSTETARRQQQLQPPRKPVKTRKVFVLRRMACFGSPKFDRQSALHILSADSRFPDIEPGQQKENGNHFLALFPVAEHIDEMEERRKRKGGRRIRGGCIKNDVDNVMGGHRPQFYENPESESIDPWAPPLILVFKNASRWWKRVLQNLGNYCLSS